jgi:hypothetical protein
MSSANKDEVWRSIICGIINVAPQDRLAVISRLILSNEDAAKVAGGLLECATGMVRINVAVSEWLPQMVRAKEDNPMVSGKCFGGFPPGGTVWWELSQGRPSSEIC